MSDQPQNGNGVKMMLAAAAIGMLTGVGGTYKVADDYGEAVCSLKVANAVTADRLTRLEAERQSPPKH